MYPYIEIFGIGFNMTGLGIIFSLFTFLIVVGYLCKKYHQNFLKFFYYIPIFIIIPYILGAYVHFVFDFGSFPYTLKELIQLLSPENYNFHFVGLIIGLVVASLIFFKSFSRNENKKIWADILFFSCSLSFIPLGIFLLFGDSFLWKINTWPLSIKALHPNSELNKFEWVYPVGVFLSLVWLFASIIIWFFKKGKKQIGIGIWWFILLIIFINIVFFFQQYPKYIPISYKNIIFDIKNYISFLVIMMCIYTRHKRNRRSKNH